MLAWFPENCGPDGPHKIQGKVLALLRKRAVPGEPIQVRELAEMIREELGPRGALVTRCPPARAAER